MKYPDRKGLIWAAPVSLVILLVAVTLVMVAVRTPVPTTDDQTGLLETAGNIYMGLSTLEERIAISNVIARVQFLSARQGIEPVDDKFSPALIFRFRVLEYLKGGGSAEIESVTVQTRRYETRAEAEAHPGDLLTSRETRWDNREAIVFLQQAPGNLRYWLGYHSYRGEDGYTLESRRQRNWLPEAQTGGGVRSSGSQRFLLSLDTRPSGSATRSSGDTGETRALTDLKSEISDIEAEVAAGGGSDEYKECVAYKYLWERWSSYHVQKVGSEGAYNFEPYEYNTESGLASGTQVFEDEQAQFNERKFGSNPSETIYEYWLERGDANLFLAQYPGRIYTRRPLPGGQYDFYYNDREAVYIICDAYPEAERTRFRHIVTATAPAGVLHEVFFDPVLVGTAVKADSTNGVLEPASFTDGNAAAATLQSVSYEPPSTGSGSGTVKLQVDLHTGLDGHRLELVELDGSVSLWLDVDAATVDAANKTLSWTVTSQPWDDGDKLMLRVEEVELGIALFGLPSTITVGQSDTFTVRASGLSAAESYRVRLSSSNDAVGFARGCGIGGKTVSVPSGSTSHRLEETLHGCRAMTGTVTATLLRRNGELGTAIGTASASVEVESASSVAVTLSARTEQYSTWTDMTVEWTDAGGCESRYLVGLYDSNETIVRNLGFHPAPGTTSLEADPRVYWDDIPSLDWTIRVTCAPSGGHWIVVGEATLQSGLPSTP